MKTRQFWYPLPERLIAQRPAERRGTERMLVLHRDTGMIEHRHIADIVEYITPNDLLVVNDTKVFPARLIGAWPDTKGAVEMLLVNAAPMDADDGRPSMTAAADTLRAPAHGPARRVWPHPRPAVRQARGHRRGGARRQGALPDGVRARGRLRRRADGRAALHAGDTGGDRGEGRQARRGHAARRPDEQRQDLDAVNACKARGGRVFCVGSTTVRTLESVAAATDGDEVVRPGSGASDIFIYPPYRFRVCDCMLTNFHLPQSTLLMMVSALAGRERILCSYAMAVQKNYMFFSYGDCMLIV